MIRINNGSSMQTVNRMEVQVKGYEDTLIEIAFWGQINNQQAK